MRERLVEFLTCLPITFPDPDILLEEDGDYGVEWYISRDKQFSVSVGKDGYACAWMTGSMFVKRGAEKGLVARIEKWLKESA